jgi:hypothetical protein
MTDSDITGNIESDITGNITADCHQLTQNQEMINMHEADCTCDCCCQLSEPNCQDSLDQCEETQQPSERRNKMKSKLMPILVNCVLVLSVIGFSDTIAQARSGDDLININPIVENRIGNILSGSVAIVIDELNDAGATATAEDVIAENVIESNNQPNNTINGERRRITLARIDNRIDAPIIDIENSRSLINEVISAVDPIEVDRGEAIASVDRLILPEIRR